jgi:hypothetical protein
MLPNKVMQWSMLLESRDSTMTPLRGLRDAQRADYRWKNLIAGLQCMKEM